MNAIWLFVHVLGVSVWIGGMSFALFCLRPAASDLLPAQRAPLMAGALGRFFAQVQVAILALWVSGLAMLVPVGMRNAPLAWHLMLGAAAVMTLVFGWIRWGLFPQVQHAVGTEDLPGAAAGLERIRVLVMLNLVLGMATIGFATIPR